MRCDKFQSIASDLACDHLMEAGLRQSAIAHAESCASCAARLEDERELSSALRAAAIDDEGAAPAKIKSALLAEFQRASSAPVVSIKQRRPPRWALAAAAAVFTLIAIPVIGRLIQSDSPVATTQVMTAPAQSDSTNAKEVLPEAQAGLSDQPVALNNEAVAKGASVVKESKGRAAKKVIAGASRKTDKDDAANEFIPLTYLTDRTAMASGTVVRVEMARSTLLALGLPMSIDRAGETITADVVVGDDGLARAIRIVY